MDVDSDIMTCGFEPPVTVASNRSTGYSLQLKYDGTRWRTGGEVKGETGEWGG